jgi:N-acetylglucosaminyldiphosphoundecaprenol N-acetyl-beta-D-mannosaminyltransferase
VANLIFSKLITSENEIFSAIDSSTSNNSKLLVTYLNQHCFNIYCSDSAYRNLLENHFKVYADGAGINFAYRFLWQKHYVHFNATDLNEKIINILTDKSVKFYIVGGNFSEEEVNSKFKNNNSFAGYLNGYFDDSDIQDIANTINKQKPEVILIGMGVPKQEIIAEKLSNKVDTSLFICVGNFFEFYLGTVKRIPEKYRNWGVEWIYRLFQEPKRLWNRYIIGIPLFIFRVMKFKLLNSKIG